jgi:hypothetical protein
LTPLPAAVGPVEGQAVVARETRITLKQQIAALLENGNVGSLGLILDDKDIVLLLKAAIQQEGNITAFAKRHEMERTIMRNSLG